jgi:type VI secretion system protein ImpK
MSNPHAEARVRPRPDNLAMILQETLTAAVRLKAARAHVSDAQSFRMQIRDALRTAEQQARTAGYSDRSVSLAVFAVVAFLDESILSQQNPVFASWPGKPLQDELFGGHVAGETFFENVTRLLSQSDSVELGDVLEVYQMCMLLGYRGRYGLSSQGEMSALLKAVSEKIDRTRRKPPHLFAGWELPLNEKPPSQSDRWVRPLLYTAAACFVLAVALLAGFTLSLNSGINELRTLNGQSR